MDALTINRWVGGLGSTYDELVTKGVVPDQLLKPMFDTRENEELLQSPAPGVKLWFWAETKCLEKVMITLIPTVSQPVYTGSLPAPFTLSMDQKYVRAALGEPMVSKKPVKLPGGLGMRGGSDTYYLDQGTHPNIKVTLSYLESLAVNNISFTLINKGHD
ncbi:DUF6392 family protein [Pseudomonas sp.]|uniref:DUF6392 family protein n=1 Tax=Pseudomonas sp. TaxID=306 RepID=UPI003A970417